MDGREGAGWGAWMAVTERGRWGRMDGGGSGGFKQRERSAGGSKSSWGEREPPRGRAQQVGLPSLTSGEQKQLFASGKVSPPLPLANKSGGSPAGRSIPLANQSSCSPAIFFIIIILFFQLFSFSLYCLFFFLYSCFLISFLFCFLIHDLKLVKF